MSIKFPDLQVLVARTDQIPKTHREGDQSGAGKLAPQVNDEYSMDQRRITDTPQQEKIPQDKKHKENRKQDSDQQKKRKKQSSSVAQAKKTNQNKRHIDILA